MSKVKLRQINKQFVSAISIPNEDTRPVKGFDICEEPYANIFLCARKKSGKTSAVFKIIKECSDRKTIIVIFCSTAYKDKNWIQMRKYFIKKGMDVRVYTSIYEDGEDQLANLIDDLKQTAKDEGDSDSDSDEDLVDGNDDVNLPMSGCDDILNRLTRMYNHSQGQTNIYKGYHKEPKEKEKKEKKSKYLAPEYMIIFDDLSSELKAKSLTSLMKFNRHFKAKLIVSSQWLHDLGPESRKQIDLFLIFKGFSIEKIALIYKDCDSAIPFETFYKIYKKATEKPHSFMYICTTSDEIRRNFDCQFIFKSKSLGNDDA